MKEKGKYGFLVDDAGKWTERKDVRDVHVMDPRGVDYKDMEKFGAVQEITRQVLELTASRLTGEGD